MPFDNSDEARRASGFWRGRAVAELVNDDGRKFVACVLAPGERYGRGGACVTDDAEVEFYDATYAGERGFTDVGQFVSRYYLDTLVGENPAATCRGILLDGGVPEWNVSAANVRATVKAAIRALIPSTRTRGGVTR